MSILNPYELPKSSVRGLAETVVCSHFTDENNWNSEKGRTLLKSHSKRQADPEEGPGLLILGWDSL